MTPSPSNPAAPVSLMHVRWSTANGELLHGLDNTTQKWTDEDLVLGIAYPNLVTAPIEVFLRSSAALSGSPEILNNVRFFLTGPASDVSRLLNDWPSTGNGLEISFDGGTTWARFGLGVGNPNDPTTWIPLPGIAVSSVAPDGQIAPMDTAHFHLRLNVGQIPSAIFSRIQIGIDCDVL
jgi:hypothetical protein